MSASEREGMGERLWRNWGRGERMSGSKRQGVGKRLCRKG